MSLLRDLKKDRDNCLEEITALKAQLAERDEQIAELKYYCQVTSDNKENLRALLAAIERRF